MTPDIQLPQPYDEASEKPKFIGIPLKNMKTDAVLGAQLFIKIGSDKYVKYRDADLQFDAGVRSRLRARKHTHIYIGKDDTKSLNSYLEANMVNILNSNDIPVLEKVDVLHDTMTHLNREIFVDPGRKENIQLSKRLVETATGFILPNSNIFGYLFELSTVDYYTYSHCVDVMTNSIMLGQQLGIKDERKLTDLGHSALLHDIGKSFVNPEVTQKPGPLNDGEFAEMKKHPDFGYEALNSANELPERVLQVVRKHHEEQPCFCCRVFVLLLIVLDFCFIFAWVLHVFASFFASLFAWKNTTSLRRRTNKNTPNSGRERQEKHTS